MENRLYTNTCLAETIQNLGPRHMLDGLDRSVCSCLAIPIPAHPPLEHQKESKAKTIHEPCCRVAIRPHIDALSYVLDPHRSPTTCSTGSTSESSATKRPPCTSGLGRNLLLVRGIWWRCWRRGWSRVCPAATWAQVETTDTKAQTHAAQP